MGSKVSPVQQETHEIGATLLATPGLGVQLGRKTGIWAQVPFGIVGAGLSGWVWLGCLGCGQAAGGVARLGRVPVGAEPLPGAWKEQPLRASP